MSFRVILLKTKKCTPTHYLVLDPRGLLTEILGATARVIQLVLLTLVYLIIKSSIIEKDHNVFLSMLHAYAVWNTPLKVKVIGIRYSNRWVTHY